MRSAGLFLVLVALQICHSVEEFTFKLYDVFPPARFVSELVSADRGRGFIIVNVMIAVLALGCYLGPVRHRWPSAQAFMWFWIVIELINGIGHPAWSVVQGGYTPGVVTAVPLLIVALLLGRELLPARAAQSM
jgi:hypothetical protein